MTFIVAALAVARLTRLITRDEFPPIQAARDWLLARWPDSDTVFATPEDARVETVEVGELWVPVESHWFGDLITCAWCASVYVAAVVVSLTYWLGPWFDWVLMVPAFSMIAGLLASWE